MLNITEVFAQLLEIIFRLIIAVGIAVPVVRLSKYLFGYDFVSETKSNNTAAAIVLFGLLVLIGLVVGLFKL